MNALSQWFVDTSFLLELGPVTHYFPLTHGGTNAHHMWRFDPLTYFVMSTFGLNAGVLWLLALLGFGTAILGNSLTKRGPLARALWLLAGVGLSVSAVLIFGFDVVTLGGIAWLPLLLSCLIFGQNAPSLGRLGLFGLTSIMFALSANQLALPASIVGVGCLWLTNDVRWSRWIQGA